jgi:hypothetical protein
VHADLLGLIGIGVKIHSDQRHKRQAQDECQEDESA